MEIVKTKSGEIRFKEKVRLENKRIITKTFKTKTHARQWKMKLETEKVQGVLGIKVTKSVPFDEVATLWFSGAERTLAPKTVINYRSNLVGKVIPYFRKMDISKVTLQDIEQLKHQLFDKRLNPKTINKVMTMVRQIFLFALERGHIRSLPFAKSLLMDTKDPEFSYFEEWEIRSLLRDEASPIFPILYLTIHTGMRLGEVTGLCWDKVNFGASRIEITRTLSARNELRNQTKSGRSRYFPMSPKLKSFLLELRNRQRDPQFVFVNENGQPYSPDHFCQRYSKPYCKKVGVRQLRFHDLRHTFASHFMMKDGNIFELKELLGHADFETTQIYAHLSPKHLEKAAGVVDFGISFGQEKADGPFLALAE